MVANALDELSETRRALRPLLSAHDPADALVSYYALWHDPNRTQLALSRDAQGRVDGFVAACRTGADYSYPGLSSKAEARHRFPFQMFRTHCQLPFYHMSAPAAKRTFDRACNRYNSILHADIILSVEPESEKGLE